MSAWKQQNSSRADSLLLRNQCLPRADSFPSPHHSLTHIGSVAHFVDIGVTRNVKGCQKQQSGRPTHFVDQHICWCGLCSVTAQFVVSVLFNDTICWCGGVFRINKWCHEEGQKQHSAQTTHFVGAFEKDTQWVCIQDQHPHHSDLPNFHRTNQ